MTEQPMSENTEVTYGDEQIDELLAGIEARANAATEGPWTHFYPAARNFANYGVIRPPQFRRVVGNVTVEAGPAVGIRYQIEGTGKVNGFDRGAIASTWEPKSRNSTGLTFQDEQFKLAHQQVRNDGEFIAHAREDVPTLAALVRQLRSQLAAALRERDRAKEDLRILTKGRIIQS